MDNALRLLQEARNDLSDIINTWRGAGIDDEKLYSALDQIDEKLLASIAAFRLSGYVVK